MRDAKAQDYWSKAYTRPHTDYLSEVDFQSLNNLPAITIPQSILVLCGLNGAGKSTIITAIKDLIGIPLSEQDLHKLNTKTILGKAVVSNQEISCTNKDGERLVDRGWDLDKVTYLDSSESVFAQNYIVQQSNLDELLEQFEEYDLSPTETEEINYIIGKRYSSCSIRELTDVNGGDSIIPYFYVEVDGETYDSKSMGIGEHFLLYLFWKINQLHKGSLLIVEEPETYISISSQISFANYLGKQMAKNGLRVIVTTHSPYIISSIRNENIRIVSRMGNNVSILPPDESLPAESILGLDNNSIGTFFVEDKVAADFLSIVLEDRCPQLLRSFTIDFVGGESEITNRLSFPYSERIKYKFIGVYDGDMRATLDTSKLKWKHCFLPGEKAIEEVFRDYMHNGDKIDKLCSFLGKDKGKTIAFLSTIDGLDCHDWFIEFSKLLTIDGKRLIMAFYQTIMKDDASIDVFVSEIYNAIQ